MSDDKKDKDSDLSSFIQSLSYEEFSRYQSMQTNLKRFDTKTKKIRGTKSSSYSNFYQGTDDFIPNNNITTKNVVPIQYIQHTESGVKVRLFLFKDHVSDRYYYISCNGDKHKYYGSTANLLINVYGELYIEMIITEQVYELYNKLQLKELSYNPSNNNIEMDKKEEEKLWIIEIPIIKGKDNHNLSVNWFEDIIYGSTVVVTHRDNILTDKGKLFKYTQDGKFVKFEVKNSEIDKYIYSIRERNLGYNFYESKKRSSSKKNTIIKSLIKELEEKGYNGKCRVLVRELKPIFKDKSKLKLYDGKGSGKYTIRETTGLYSENNCIYTIIFKSKDNKKTYCYTFDKNDTQQYPKFDNFKLFNSLDVNGFKIELKQVSEETIKLNVREDVSKDKIKGVLNNLYKNNKVFRIIEIFEQDKNLLVESDKNQIFLVKYDDIVLSIKNIKCFVPRKVKSFIPKCNIKCIYNRTNRKLIKGDIYTFEKLKDRRNKFFHNSDIIIVKDKKGNQIVTRKSNFKVV